MALKSGRTGVRNDQVNNDGLPIASTFFNALVNDLPTWTDLPSYVGGTEQLLPVNDDEPDTSPILCDIQYPDTLRNDQYFTYRESPTTKDGLAKIRGIRGNTLVWNQLVANDTTSVTLTSGHVYITVINGTFTRVNGTGQSVSVTGGTDNVFDLTKMFGSGNEPTLEEFRKLYSLSYYKNNTGSLLSFTGTGIKVTGFNQWDEEWETGSINTTTGQNSSSASRFRSKNYIPIISTESYYCKAPAKIYVYYYDADLNYLGYGSSTVSNTSFNPSSLGFGNASYMRFRCDVGATYNNDICINISDSSKNGTYEPYTSHETDLPISTFFPTGMKSVGSAYDELTPTKAITRIGAVDLGEQTWGYDSGNAAFYFTLSGIRTGLPGSGALDILICSQYVTASKPGRGNILDKQIGTGTGGGVSNSTIIIKDSAYTDATTFKSAMSGVYLFYELATPVVEATMSFE